MFATRRDGKSQSIVPASRTAIAAEIAQRLVAAGQTVAVAESSAGGLISASLLAVPGASAFYRGGAVFYDRGSVRALLGVDGLPPGTRGASEPFARWLAPAARARFGTDWAVAETGATGPDPNPYGDPAGHAWVAVTGPDGSVVAEHVLTGDADRERNMDAFASAALGLLRVQA